MHVHLAEFGRLVEIQRQRDTDGVPAVADYGSLERFGQHLFPAALPTAVIDRAAGPRGEVVAELPVSGEVLGSEGVVVANDTPAEFVEGFHGLLDLGPVLIGGEYLPGAIGQERLRNQLVEIEMVARHADEVPAALRVGLQLRVGQQLVQRQQEPGGVTGDLHVPHGGAGHLFHADTCIEEVEEVLHVLRGVAVDGVAILLDEFLVIQAGVAQHPGQDVIRRPHVTPVRAAAAEVDADAAVLVEMADAAGGLGGREADVISVADGNVEPADIDGKGGCPAFPQFDDARVRVGADFEHDVVPVIIELLRRRHGGAIDEEMDFLVGVFLPGLVNEPLVCQVQALAGVFAHELELRFPTGVRSRRPPAHDPVAVLVHRLALRALASLVPVGLAAGDPLEAVIELLE